MTVFLSTLNQMAFLFLLIVIGYILARLKAVPENSAAVLSKLENNVFIPALVLGTFMQNFTIARIGEAWQYLLGGLITILINIPLAMVAAGLCTKDDYLRKIYTYGLAFPNFAFMGNAVVNALFSDYFMGYLIFVLPFWMIIFLWGVPALLIPSENGPANLKGRLKSCLNPMFAATLVGMVVGLINPPTPDFLHSAVDTLGGCMSPVAMLLTGMTIAKIDLKSTFKNVSVYLVSLIRLIVFPLLFIGVLLLLPLPVGLEVCIICALSMPLGLNTIVVPSAYGLDTTAASGMALISHLLSCLTIPVIFLLFNLVL